MRYSIFKTFLLLKIFMDSFLFSQTIDSIFTKEDTLLYKGYEVKKSYDSQKGVWFATLKKDGKIIFTFENGYRKEMTQFGLFAFLGRDEKQLIVEQYSGGAHCCWSYWIINFSPDFRVIYDSQEYSVGYPLQPVDLDQDGVFEFSQLILTFDYFDRLSHAISPFPIAVFKYDKNMKCYIPANTKFSPYITQGIEEDIKKVKEFNGRTNFTTYDDSMGKYLSMILQVSLTYIYAGKEREAWLFYDKEYKLRDKAEMKSKIREQLKNCSIYKYIYGR
ncbi:MAG: hypothetical protein AB1410_04000 [Acidobacteriota bacterium]